MLRFKSLSTRLSVTTSLITTLVITIIAVYVLLIKSNEIRQSNMRDASLNASNAALILNQKLVTVQSVMAANAWHIEECLSSGGTDSLALVLDKLLTLDADIIGCGAALALHSQHPFALYGLRDSAVVSVELPVLDQLEHKASTAWLSRALGNDMPRWSAPHPAVDGSGVTVCTYSIPVGADGSAYLFADLPVDFIGRVIRGSLSSSLVGAILVDAKSGGLTISHAQAQEQKSRAPKLVRKNVEEMLSVIGDSLPQGRQGTLDLKVGDKSWLCIYDVVNESGWLLVFIADISAFSATVSQVALPVVLAFIATIVLLFVVIWIVIHRITRPLRLFSDSAIEISKGNFTVSLPEVRSDDEMALLRDSMLTMQQSLVNYTHQIEDSTRRQAMIRGELQIASRIQDDLLPKAFPAFPDRDDVDIRAVLIPAKQIGGDLYNYLILNDRLYFIIADVSGKSVPAAIIMAIACNVFNTFAPTTDDPSVIMQALNATTCSNNEMSGFFITALVGILDLPTGELRLCNAGHEPAIIVAPSGEVSVLRIAPNLPVGVLADKEYVSVTMPLGRGSRIVLSTDGITDAENPARQFFGFQRLIDCVTAHASDDVASIAEAITDGVMDFASDMEQTDDITLMVIDYQPSEVMMPRQIVLSVDLNELVKVEDFALSIAKALALDKAHLMKLNLALEEAVTNIIKYSAMTDKSVNAITLFASVHDAMLSVLICDKGRRFDPTKVAPAVKDTPLEQRQVGGLGIDLIHRLCRSVKYRYVNNRNCLYLSFDFS